MALNTNNRFCTCKGSGGEMDSRSGKPTAGDVGEKDWFVVPCRGLLTTQHVPA